MAAIPEVFAFFWENMGKLSDGCLIQALVKALGKSRCSYFADTQLPLGSEIRLFTLHCVDTFFPYLGCIQRCTGGVTVKTLASQSLALGRSRV